MRWVKIIIRGQLPVKSKYLLEKVCNIDSHKWQGAQKDWTLDRMTWRSEFAVMSAVNMTLKKKVMTLKNVIKMSQRPWMTPNLTLKIH